MTENERALLIACAEVILQDHTYALSRLSQALIDAVRAEQTHAVPFSPKIAVDCPACLDRECRCACQTCTLARRRREFLAQKDVRIEDLI